MDNYEHFHVSGTNRVRKKIERMNLQMGDLIRIITVSEGPGDFGLVKIPSDEYVTYFAGIKKQLHFILREGSYDAIELINSKSEAMEKGNESPEEYHKRENRGDHVPHIPLYDIKLIKRIGKKKTIDSVI